MVLLFPRVQGMLYDELVSSDISSLHGRTGAWEFALTEFRRNPLFGYGPSIFSPEYRRDVIRDPSLTWLGQAHNQVLQTMGDSGLIGLAGFVTFATVILVVGKRLAHHSAGLTLVLPIMILIRCVTESPLGALGAISVNLTLIAFTWLLLLSGVHERSAHSTTMTASLYDSDSRPRPAWHPNGHGGRGPGSRPVIRGS
jgi:O-antigen ligase